MRWLLPLLILAAFIPFSSSLDLSVSGYFFSPESKGFVNHPFLDMLFTFGIFPGYGPFFVLATSISLTLWFLPPVEWKRATLILFLTLILGGGVVTNGLLKNLWQRPRPKQITTFGGPYPFQPFYEPNWSHLGEPLKGFPCGHCTIGYYYFALYHLGRRYQNAPLKACGLFVGALLGFALGVGRVAQGAHFLSDVLVSGLVMWYLPPALLTFPSSRDRARQVESQTHLPTKMDFP